MSYRKLSHPLVEITVVLLFLVGCSLPAATAVPTTTAPPPTPTPIPAQVAPSPTPELPTAVPSPAPPTPTAMGDLKLTILYDSTAADPKLRSGGGFAALVEYGGHTLLFDTGPTGSFLLENMRQLNVDPQSIEAIIISHEHSDHTGGLQALLDTGIRPTVYVPPLYSSAFKEQVRARTELVEVNDALTILPGMHLARPVGSVVEQALAVELFRTEFGEACLEGGAGRIVTSSSK